MTKKYIGVDLGAWLSKKTSIAVIIKNKDKIILEKVEHEPLSKSYTYLERDAALVELLKTLADNSAVIAIDAPFSIPSALKMKTEKELYKFTNKLSKNYNQIKNPYLFDNSARFVLDTVDEVVLAPCATLIGAYTARMAHIFSNETYTSILNPITSPNLEEQNNSINTIEVYPRATLKVLLKMKEIPQYKKSSKNFKEKKEKMIELIKDIVEISDEIKNKIKTDDDYDAVICALTAYLVSQDDGYEKPDNPELFTNSFIYIPKIKN